MNIQWVCNDCGRSYDPKDLLWRCCCGGLLNVESFPISFPLKKIQSREASLWRYSEALPFQNTSFIKDITMGEGFTPIVPLDRDAPHLLVKLDFMMPTLSFKDRGAAVLIAKAKELGVTRVIADSSGNAGTAIAAYGGRLGITCDIYVPEQTSPKKIQQIHAYGATVHTIPGDREETAKAAVQAVEQQHIFYASHVYNPFFYQGTKTYVYELWEQLKGDLPDTLVLPVGNGTLLLGVYYGCQDLMEAGLISKFPRLIGVQAERCAPLATAYRLGKARTVTIAQQQTLAEGIAIANPPRHRQILAAVRETNGMFVTASEQKIKQAHLALAERGFYVEPTAAATYAGYLQYQKHFKHNQLNSNENERVVIPLCGAGLKAG
ncbi:threonine synthase [Pullulanibacillus pueri]|uniref:Threonine synthase n=1 Tax=Pullulanibacillus pueri TaxID=1437324 RepID=A0A8J2ZU36_9BACL|nr:threonine synthase [Pullulanibacillus pueri]MBM7681038.1 threonine synthase [Pullulanibacillus pueri]GGH76801.1 threonine synthase [Pullulanibacillus pueri]